uniref:Uncharacterized protein n=1 Tax=Morchella importuna TaxID=1174673 RepID=A0A650AF78_9PEZI|nr:hypothetical protein [Morchella importuna]QGN66685.1 hypothetical protein [Morchella importuna]
MFFAFHFNSTHCSHICKSIFHSPPPRSPGDRAACQQKICTSFGAVSGAKGAGSWFRPLKDVHSLRRAIRLIRRISMHPGSSDQGPIQRSCWVCMHSKPGNMHASKGGASRPHPFTPNMTPSLNIFFLIIK